MPFIDTEDLEPREPRPGWEGRFFHSPSMTFGHDRVHAGSSVHEQSHPHEAVWTVIAGEIEISFAGETRVAGPGWVVVVPQNAPQSLRALGDARAIVVDHPRRSSVGGVDLGRGAPGGGQP